MNNRCWSTLSKTLQISREAWSKLILPPKLEKGKDLGTALRKLRSGVFFKEVARYWRMKSHPIERGEKFPTICVWCTGIAYFIPFRNNRLIYSSIPRKRSKWLSKNWNILSFLSCFFLIRYFAKAIEVYFVIIADNQETYGRFEKQWYKSHFLKI